MKKIVLTGGPCGGKTTILPFLKEKFEDLGYHVFTVPESATLAIIGGIPTDIGEKDFQRAILRMQMFFEDYFENYAKQKEAQGKKTVVICDRGFRDHLAYLSDPILFEELMYENGLTPDAYLSRYDMVVDLLSLATCKPEDYNLGNAARTESIEDAKALDERTSEAWSNHHNMIIFSSSIAQKDEQMQVFNAVKNYLDDTIEKESYLYDVDTENSDLRRYLKKRIVKSKEMYFNINDDDVQCLVTEKENRYYLEVFTISGGDKKTLVAYTIDVQEFKKFCDKFDCVRVLEKQEVNFVSDEHLCKLNLYSDRITLEVFKNNTPNHKLPAGIVARKIGDLNHNTTLVNLDAVKQLIK